jgi:hypothetical protein
MLQANRSTLPANGNKLQANSSTLPANSNTLQTIAVHRSTNSSRDFYYIFAAFFL